MSFLNSIFGFNNFSSYTQTELPIIFPLGISEDEFTDIDVTTIYSRILTDCIERIEGIPEDVHPLLWDNFLQSESTYGLISLLSNAMAYKEDLFLIYDPSISLLREATDDEEEQIEKDYANKGKSASGIFLSFENYSRSDMVNLYSLLEYYVVSSMNKMMNLSKAIQFKMSNLRGSVSLTDSEGATEQAKAIAKGLANGKDILIDAKDEIATSAPDISSIRETIIFLDAKRSFYYGMPLSYITGEQTPGIGSTGEADTKAVERGLKQYYISILKPILEALFGIKVSFKSNDFRQISSALEAIKTFELVSDDLLSQENKRIIISKLFDVELDQATNKKSPQLISPTNQVLSTSSIQETVTE